ncbi:MAG: hypothetical protein OQJ97_17415 [Rhodospirillales bacterium]|nr:hypothetical protein [Rhodospirillales bacterium]
MSWFYPAKVNMALAAMAIPPNQFDGAWRSGMQQIGKSGGLTPQETALVIVGYGLGINYPDDVETAIGVWRHEGKIDISKPEIIEALSKMGFNVG